jgi:hypothetical protein
MLQLIVIAAIVFAGWYVASTFSTAVLLVATALGVVVWILIKKDSKGRGLDGVPHMIILMAAPVFFVSVWISWYLVNNFEFAGQFLHSYILR